MTTILRSIPLVLGVIVFSGCTVGPRYVPPVDTPLAMDAYTTIEQLDRNNFETLWWKQFKDPVLDELVLATLHNNRDLRAAFAGWRAARALRDDAANDHYPTITSRASTQQGKAIVPGITTSRADLARYDLGLDTFWELDLFGRLSHQLEAADARGEVALADFQKLQVSLIAEVADAYGTLRSAQWRERIAQEHQTIQQASLRLASERHEAGFGAKLDVLRAQARLAAVHASIPDIQGHAIRARHRIAVLLGLRPDQMKVDLSFRELPAIDTTLPIGNPGELLRRRPDIRAAERQLAASAADIGVATADLFPRVSLTGFLGFTAGRGSQLGSAGTQAWTISPSITWSAFDIGSARAQLRATKAHSDQALLRYEQVVLLAVEEAANAFSDYGVRQQQLKALMERRHASQAAAQRASVLYQEGAADYLILLDAEREQLAAEEAQAEAEARAYRGIVAIYKALGGGWQPI